MNKKNLSVVLAGAMLATSVAPVLADTTTAKEYSLDDIKLLENEIVSTMKTKMLTTNTVLKADTTFLSQGVIDLLTDANQSAYGVRVLDAKGNKVDLNSLSSADFNTPSTFETYDVTKVGAALKNIKSGYTVEVIERGTTEFYGELIPGTTPRKETLNGEYTPSTEFDDTSIATGATFNSIKPSTAGTNVLVKSLANDVDKTGKKDKLTVEINKLKNPSDASKGNVTITLTSESKKIDGRLPLTSDNKLLDYTKKEDINAFDHFDTLGTWAQSTEIKTNPTVSATYKLTSVAEDPNAIKASDLYDGMLLTAKGTELLSDLTNAAEAVGSNVENVTDAINSSVEAEDNALVKLSKSTFTDSAVYKFTISYYKNATDAAHDNGKGKDAYKTVTVHSTNKKEINALYNLLKEGKFNVGIVGGEDRYATAVNVAKAQGTAAFGETANGDIVLVNGSSLVDGLSAAPLAATKSAPVLLTKADSLPKSTKEYIKTLLANKTTVANKKKVTVTLVGGKSVLTNSLIEELEEMGLTVKRLGGDNREATSLAVAKEIVDSTKNTNDVFVVGGNGEADAMAISAVAASNETPIIVSSVHGLTEYSLDFLKENSAKAEVTVVGGESVVSAEELDFINESLTLNKASRVAGANRFETNAKIIEKYYGEKATASTGIVLAKDGQNNKGELVDALSAANYAVSVGGPIVLATDSLKDVQKDVLLNKFNTGVMTKVVQVGQGAERSVIETVAKLFNVEN